MLMLKILYKRQNDGDTEYSANVIANSPEEVCQYLTQQYGELPYFRCIGRQEIHAVMPSCEKALYLKVQRMIDNGK